jgi:inosose dehydratase
MTFSILTRRNFITQTCVTAALMSIHDKQGRAAEGNHKGLHLSSNQYSWQTFYSREGKDFMGNPDEGFKDIASSGINGFEGIISSPQQMDERASLLKKHGLEMRSIYVNSTLHEKDQAEQSIQQILAIAEKARSAGTRIFVTNPNPIQWGSAQYKSDEQLKVQAESMNQLGRQLQQKGITLAYHNHDIELHNAAREFHHMMNGTDPENVSLCLDAHWIYRGSGNSSIALFDVLKLYGSRVSEVHLRQSKNNVWTETFGEGDIDYQRLADYLHGINNHPHLVLEQAPEQGTPHTMGPVEVHKQSAEYARKVFAQFSE